MAEICRHFIISGKVQGVFFRDNTRKKAEELKITGWVKNLDNGCVEVLACGGATEIDLLTKWLWQGPSLARVDKVVQEDCPMQEHSDFVIS